MKRQMAEKILTQKALTLKSLVSYSVFLLPESTKSSVFYMFSNMFLAPGRWGGGVGEASKDK